MLANDYAVVEVTSVTTLLDRFVGDHSVESLELAAGFPQVVEASGDLINLASGGDVAVIRAVPRWSPDSPGPLQLVERVRDTMVPNVLESQHVDAEVVVGGLSAQIVDITAESLRKLPVVVGLVVVLSFVLLALVFRSIAIPIKAILMNVLGIAAAYGLLVVVFQEGAGARLFDFQRDGDHPGLSAAADLRRPLRALDGLRGLSPGADQGGVGEDAGTTRRPSSAGCNGPAP